MRQFYFEINLETPFQKLQLLERLNNLKINTLRQKQTPQYFLINNFVLMLTLNIYLYFIRKLPIKFIFDSCQEIF
jgi:hypothetical protein